MTRPDLSLGIYVHVPFCASRCPYCDFYSHCDRALIPAFVSAAGAELRALGRTAAAAPTAGAFDRPVRSVYFGGGTPSLLPVSSLRSLLDAVRETYAVTPDAEITLECNPGLGEPERYFAAAAAAGINRVSLGLQSAVDRERRALGRRADARQALACLTAARAAGIPELSLDVMAGIPGQTLETLRYTLDWAAQSGAAHLSVYLLKLEPGTVFERKKETLDLPDEDTQAEMYLFLCEHLRKHGFRHYEISNFCREDRVGRHNLRYWQGGEYLGVGPGAYGYLGGVRYHQPPSLSGFLSGEAAVCDGPGGDADERLMLALRTDTGVSPARLSAETGVTFTRRFGERVRFYQERGLMLEKDGFLSLTDRGMLLSNDVIASLLACMRGA